jgi:hypothetical protein
MRALVLGVPLAIAFGIPCFALDHYVVTKGTEHQIWTSPGGDTTCFEIRSLATGQAATGRFRRTRAGGKKDLGNHHGSVCFTAKAPVYVLYVAADEEDIRVTSIPTKGEGPRPSSIRQDRRGGVR